ncbi:ABC transporter substrate-binding protein [Rhizocola hellebori]|uniref:ABC transporter substrate-binding protein n=1 Tax=Rhizocola hellebori TaxID=1392758 RepID=A0A8J3Q7U6_9ACTN|nr:extracellular solute-binding protein [Rhizocola hellebori]GIH04821.1 ABC transporter substrate-binding protein [Rhizocola hellebori]
MTGVDRLYLGIPGGMGTRQWRLPAALAALILLGASACGGDDNQGNQTGANLQMYAFSSSAAEDAALNAAIAAYNKLGRNTVRLNILPEYDTALQTALAGGQPPDVFYVNDNKLPDLARAGALEPIGDKVDNPDDFYESLRQSFTFEGAYYCPPKDFSTLQLIYNVDELAAAGVQPPKTWEELTAAAQKLTKPGRPGLAINPEFYRWGVFLAQAGGWPTNSDVTKMTMDTAQVRQALQYVADLHKSGSAATAAAVGTGWGGEALGKGKAAMTIEGNWIVGAMKADFPNLKYAVAELPAGPSGKATMAFSVCYGVAKASKNKAAAIDFVKFLTSSEQQLAFTKDFPVMPSRKSLSEQWLASKPELRAFVNGAAYAKKAVFIPGFAPVVDSMNDGIQGLAAGDRTVDQVVMATQQAGQDVLK